MKFFLFGYSNIFIPETSIQPRRKKSSVERFVFPFPWMIGRRSTVATYRREPPANAVTIATISVFAWARRESERIYPIIAERLKSPMRMILRDFLIVLFERIAPSERDTGIWWSMTLMRILYQSTGDISMPARIPNPSKIVWRKIAIKETSATWSTCSCGSSWAWSPWEWSCEWWVRHSSII